MDAEELERRRAAGRRVVGGPVAAAAGVQPPVAGGGRAGLGQGAGRPAVAGVQQVDHVRGGRGVGGRGQVQQATPLARPWRPRPACGGRRPGRRRTGTTPGSGRPARRTAGRRRPWRRRRRTAGRAGARRTPASRRSASVSTACSAAVASWSWSRPARSAPRAWSAAAAAKSAGHGWGPGTDPARVQAATRTASGAPSSSAAASRAVAVGGRLDRRQAVQVRPRGGHGVGDGRVVGGDLFDGGVEVGHGRPGGRQAAPGQGPAGDGGGRDGVPDGVGQLVVRAGVERLLVERRRDGVPASPCSRRAATRSAAATGHPAVGRHVDRRVGVAGQPQAGRDGLPVGQRHGRVVGVVGGDEPLAAVLERGLGGVGPEVRRRPLADQRQRPVVGRGGGGVVGRGEGRGGAVAAGRGPAAGGGVVGAAAGGSSGGAAGVTVSPASVADRFGGGGRAGRAGALGGRSGLAGDGGGAVLGLGVEPVSMARRWSAACVPAGDAAPDGEGGDGRRGQLPARPRPPAAAAAGTG